MAAWAERKDFPLFMSVFGATMAVARITGSLIFSVTMTSANAQLIFFISMSVVSFLSGILLNSIYGIEYSY